jgi:hypothetical protein
VLGCRWGHSAEETPRSRRFAVRPHPVPSGMGACTGDRRKARGNWDAPRQSGLGAAMRSDPAGREYGPVRATSALRTTVSPKFIPVLP